MKIKLKSQNFRLFMLLFVEDYRSAIRKFHVYAYGWMEYIGNIDVCLEYDTHIVFIF